MSGEFYTPRQQEVLRETVGTPGRHKLLFGGSRSGKTFLFCSAIAARAVAAPGSRHLILRKYKASAVESVALDTMPKVFRLRYPEVTARWIDRYGFFSLDREDGPASEIWISGIDDAERFDKVLGKEFATIYCNEASELGYDIYTPLQSRLAQVVEYELPGEQGPITRQLSQRFYVDLNPTVRAHWTYRLFVEGVDPVDGRKVDASEYQWDQMNPTENPLLPQEYIKSLESLPERERRRFFYGEFGADDVDALWKRENIRRSPTGELPVNLTRVVVSIDPATTSKIGSDETGIVVAGVDQSATAHILEDASGRLEPAAWARRALLLYQEFGADRLIYEANQGGDMVRQVLEAEAAELGMNPLPPIEGVSVFRGKVLRAEPVAALYERGKVVHLREFPELEDQMCTFTADFDRKARGYSPDRVDSLVQAVSALFPHLAISKARVEQRAAARRQSSYSTDWEVM